MTPTNQPKSRMEEELDRIEEIFVTKVKESSEAHLDPTKRVAPVMFGDFIRSSFRQLIDTYDRETDVSPHTEEETKLSMAIDHDIASVCYGFDWACRVQSAARAKWKGEKV